MSIPTNLGTSLSPGGIMSEGDWLTSPLGLCTLTFTHGQLFLAFNGTSTPFTPDNGPASTCRLTRTELVINSTPFWTSSASGPVAGLDVQDDGEAVLYSANGTPVWVGSPLVSPDALVTRAAQVQTAIDQLLMRFAELSTDLSRFLAVDLPKAAEIALDGAATDYHKPVTAMRPRALDKEEAEDTGT
jgi:hypothetical protein